MSPGVLIESLVFGAALVHESIAARAKAGCIVQALIFSETGIGELGHSVEDVAAGEYLAPLGAVVSSSKPAAEDCFVPEEGVLCSRLLVLPRFDSPPLAADGSDVLDMGVALHECGIAGDDRVFAGRDDDARTAGRSSLVRTTTIAAAGGGHSTDRLDDLVQQTREPHRVADGAVSELGGLDPAVLVHRGDGQWGEPDGQVSSTPQSPVILRPVPRPIPGLVAGVHLRAALGHGDSVLIGG